MDWARTTARQDKEHLSVGIQGNLCLRLNFMCHFREKSPNPMNAPPTVLVPSSMTQAVPKPVSSGATTTANPAANKVSTVRYRYNAISFLENPH